MNKETLSHQMLEAISQLLGHHYRTIVNMVSSYGIVKQHLANIVMS